MNPLSDAIRAAVAKWDPDRQDDWNERAAMIQYGDHQDRETAERKAFFELRKLVVKKP
jgi:Arc/MetJ-type ribon-helix-helix transcriptional regulator